MIAEQNQQGSNSENAEVLFMHIKFKNPDHIKGSGETVQTWCCQNVGGSNQIAPFHIVDVMHIISKDYNLHTLCPVTAYYRLATLCVYLLEKNGSFFWHSINLLIASNIHYSKAIHVQTFHPCSSKRARNFFQAVVFPAHGPVNTK